MQIADFENHLYWLRKPIDIKFNFINRENLIDLMDVLKNEILEANFYFKILLTNNII